MTTWIVDQAVELFRENWGIISANPGLFVGCGILAAVLAFLLARWLYGERVKNGELHIKSLEGRVHLHKDSMEAMERRLQHSKDENSRLSGSLVEKDARVGELEALMRDLTRAIDLLGHSPPFQAGVRQLEMPKSMVSPGTEYGGLPERARYAPQAANVGGDVTTHRLMEFLARNSGEAYSVADLQSRLDSPLLKILNALQVLESAGLIKQDPESGEPRYYVPYANRRSNGDG
jgi:hypothetical protein